MLSRRSAKAFDALIEALVSTEQEHAAELLDHSKTTELVLKRNAERNSNSHTMAQASSSGFTSSSAVVPSASAVGSTHSSTTRVPSSPANAVPSGGQERSVPPGMYSCAFMSIQSIL